MSKLGEFLELLGDGSWHTLTTIAGTLKLNPDKVEQTAEILAKQDLVRHDSQASKVKLSPEWIALLGHEEENL